MSWKLLHLARKSITKKSSTGRFASTGLWDGDRTVRWQDSRTADGRAAVYQSMVELTFGVVVLR